MLTQLYASNLTQYIRPLITKKWFSMLAGWYTNTRLSRMHIASFTRKHTIDCSEFEKSPSEFVSFNDFFIRKLKQSARPIDNRAEVFVSPADGLVSVYANISLNDTFLVKNAKLNLETLVQDKVLAQEYVNGTLIIIRLSPWDYHRFHFPVAGIVEKLERITGIYESVNPIAYHYNARPLEVNERHRITLKTDQFDNVLILPVGALCVGRIKETFDVQKTYSKGDEMGYFEFGGSTLVLLFKPGTITVLEEYTSASLENELPIKMGMCLGTAVLPSQKA